MEHSLDIALDVEGVLADTHKATQKHSDMLEPHECPPPNWEFRCDEHYDEFMDVSQHLWRENPHHIPPVEHGLRYSTGLLNDFHNVDIVTHRRGVDQQLREWLDGYGIEYDNFYVSDGHKSDIGNHDVHIDDSPNVVTDATTNGRVVMLVCRPYNAAIENARDVQRVSGVEHATEILTQRNAIAEINEQVSQHGQD
jgi:hypothetical protein